VRLQGPVNIPCGFPLCDLSSVPPQAPGGFSQVAEIGGDLSFLESIGWIRSIDVTLDLLFLTPVMKSLYFDRKWQMYCFSASRKVREEGVLFVM